MSSVLVEDRDKVRLLILNRPEKRNAADLEMQRLILQEFTAVLADPSLRAVILTGSGRAFSAGGDRDVLNDILAGTSSERDELGRVNIETARTMLGLQVPAIAAVNGPAIGYAAGLVALCDIVIMGRGAFLSDPHVQYGLGPSWATQVVWPRLTSELRARELLVSGRRVYAEEALRLGLCTQVCPDEEELETALLMAHELRGLPREGIAAAKRAFNRPLLAELSAHGTLPV